MRPDDLPGRLILAAALLLTVGPVARGDGLVVAPREYKGSLEERAQEALILFHAGDARRPATEDLILKIRVEGSAASFAWILALPDEPTTAPEDSALFEELHRYAQRRKADASRSKPGGAAEKKTEEAPGAAGVELISRKDVGSYDVSVVREQRPGALNAWLADNGYRRIERADDLIESYRAKKYVFACVKVREATLKEGTTADLHPLRFTFRTGGRDGVYFPMRLTGLQAGPFDVNLYVLYGKWLNDRINGFGYAHRGFALDWRDYDGPKCEPNAGKRWSDPASDPYLAPYAGLVPAVAKLCQKLHPGERYYLTNIKATGLRPADVRDWADDLWLFPYYNDPRRVPDDAREGGPASAGYPRLGAAMPEASPVVTVLSRPRSWTVPAWSIAAVLITGAVLVLSIVGAVLVLYLVSPRRWWPARDSKPAGEDDFGPTRP